METVKTKEESLRKDLGLMPAMALVVGMVIGSGIFMKPGKVLMAAGDSTMGLAAWMLGGIITITAGLTIAELGAQIPRTGGLYPYLNEVYGPDNNLWTGYNWCAWALFWSAFNPIFWMAGLF